ncbi:hypothetical protein Srot_2870 [Segniliparus rotundus DSM 44985]|uniref:TPR repeat domain-containing protein n=2 Tax=Segniliparus rotundus TaxID=286802 RepID=D6ZDP4_SEGRD|nr:hypothetical protein Srot_2870 [Segniliparus rotundus DSM 44985]
MPVRYEKPEGWVHRGGDNEFWLLTGPLQAALRPPGVIVVAPVLEQRRNGRIEAERLDNWSRIARIADQQGEPPYGGSVINGALLERAADLLRAIAANPALSVTVSRKPTARATIAAVLQEMLAAAGRDRVWAHDLIAGPDGRAFLRDLCAFGWTDDGEAAAALFSHVVSCADDEIERMQNRMVQENDPGAAVRWSDKKPGAPFLLHETRRSVEIARAIAEALDPLADEQLDQIPPVLARELARAVLRDRRETDKRLKHP